MLRTGSPEELCAAHELGATRAWLVNARPSQVMNAMRGVVDDACVVTALSGTPTSCADVRSIARDCHDSGRTVLADAGVTGLFGCAYCRLGADVTVAGIGDELALVALADSGLVGRFPRLGAVIADSLVADDDEAAIGCLREVLEEGRAQWRRCSDAAQVVASYLRCHPAIDEVRYPGLKGDPSFDVAARTLQAGFGPWVDYRGHDGGWNRVACTADDARAQVMELERGLREALAEGPCAD